ncbi:MAG: AbrB/MazE/SpoVT family DNA-binding domain-containing protein [Gammaproteobacteria bacterium]|nr:AbrB/MazE/SpoVT family DNA-binding domain-containing protein [Gammaproteobacteria bacterium]
MFTSHLSSKGQIVIPKIICKTKQWVPGEYFAIIECNDGILFKPIKPFEKTSLEDVFGCIHYKGPKKSIKAMENAVLMEARKKK